MWGEVRTRLFMVPSLWFVGCCRCGWMVPPLSFGLISLVMQHNCAASTSKTDIDVASLLLCFLLASSFCLFADKAHWRCPDIGLEPDCRFHKDESSVSSRWMETGRESLVGTTQSLLCCLRHFDCFLGLPFVITKAPSHLPSFTCRVDHTFQSRYRFHPHSRPRPFLDSASNPMIGTEETNTRSDMPGV